jgi:hypothetical protein
MVQSFICPSCYSLLLYGSSAHLSQTPRGSKIPSPHISTASLKLETDVAIPKWFFKSLSGSDTHHLCWKFTGKNHLAMPNFKKAGKYSLAMCLERREPQRVPHSTRYGTHSLDLNCHVNLQGDPGLVTDTREVNVWGRTWLSWGILTCKTIAIVCFSLSLHECMQYSYLILFLVLGIELGPLTC